MAVFKKEENFQICRHSSGRAEEEREGMAQKFSTYETKRVFC